MKLSDLNPNDIRDLVKMKGYSIVSNQILEEGMQINFMYREEPVDEEDSGWRFLSGREAQDYLDDADNSKFIGVNTMANLDETIIPYLRYPKGTELARSEGDTDFVVVKE
ncbi:MAG: DUF2185 domain-containing protein [Bacteroidales bacterium]|nr:DUF2185 domain-containing protein [Bacteroidales bacterium]